MSTSEDQSMSIVNRLTNPEENIPDGTVALTPEEEKKLLSEETRKRLDELIERLYKLEEGMLEEEIDDA